MNSRERFLTALRGERPDRTPVANVAALTTLELQVRTGCWMPHVHRDPEQMAALCVANHEVLGFDGVSFIINYFSEPAALGCEMNWGDERTLPMYLSHPWLNPDCAVVPGDLLGLEPIQNYLETIRIAKKKYGGKMAVLGKVMGPFSMVQVMHGLEDTMVDMIENPEAVAYLLDVAADLLVECANAQFEAGIDAIAIGEGGAGANMLSPSMHESILLPVHQRMLARIHGPSIMHICGDVSPRFHLLGRTGQTCFNFDWNISPEIMRDAAHGYSIMGNISTTDLRNATVEVIGRQVEQCLDAGVDIISPGCAISPECPNANLRAIVETVEQWARNH